MEIKNSNNTFIQFVFYFKNKSQVVCEIVHFVFENSQKKKKKGKKQSLFSYYTKNYYQMLFISAI